MMTWPIGFLAGLDYVAYKPVDVVNTLARQGYEAVSWPFAWFDPRRKNRSNRKVLVTNTRDAGLKVSEWVIQLDYVSLDAEIRQDRIRHTLEALRELAALEIRAPVNVFTGPAPWDKSAPRLGKEIPEGKAWEMVYRAFDEIIPLAEREGLTLAVEPVFGHLVHDYYTLQELLQHYPLDCLCVNFDPSHGILYGNDTAWAIRQLGPKIVHVHLKDAVGKPGGLPGETFEFPLLGEGQVPWKDMMQSLEAIGYAGCTTVEFEAFVYYQQILHNNPVTASQVSMDLVRSLGVTGNNH